MTVKELRKKLKGFDQTADVDVWVNTGDLSGFMKITGVDEIGGDVSINVGIPDTDTNTDD